MLNGVLSLGDIRDVERLCDRIAEQAIRSRQASLSPALREELVAYLIGETWELFLRYDDSDDGRGRKTFSGFAVPQLRFRVLDWWKKKLGRGAGPGEWGVLSTGELDECELERVLGSGRRDDPSDRLPAFSGLQPARSGKVRGLVDARRRAAPRRVA